MHLFGIQDEAVREQINYVLDENAIIGKGPNTNGIGTLSLVFDGIKRLNKSEKHLKITCDNAGGQNKNNATIWFYLYLVICGYYESIELNLWYLDILNSSVMVVLDWLKNSIEKRP